jgi:hypothetical protein
MHPSHYKNPATLYLISTRFVCEVGRRRAIPLAYTYLDLIKSLVSLEGWGQETWFSSVLLFSCYPQVMSISRRILRRSSCYSFFLFLFPILYPQLFISADIHPGMLTKTTGELCLPPILVSPRCDDNGVSCIAQCEKEIYTGKVTATCVPLGCLCTVCTPRD